MRLYELFSNLNAANGTLAEQLIDTPKVYDILSKYSESEVYTSTSGFEMKKVVAWCHLLGILPDERRTAALYFPITGTTKAVIEWDLHSQNLRQVKVANLCAKTDDNSRKAFVENFKSLVTPYTLELYKGDAITDKYLTFPKVISKCMSYEQTYYEGAEVHPTALYSYDERFSLAVLSHFEEPVARVMLFEKRDGVTRFGRVYAASDASKYKLISQLVDKGFVHNENYCGGAIVQLPEGSEYIPTPYIDSHREGLGRFDLFYSEEDHAVRIGGGASYLGRWTKLSFDHTTGCLSTDKATEEISELLAAYREVIGNDTASQREAEEQYIGTFEDVEEFGRFLITEYESDSISSHLLRYFDFEEYGSDSLCCGDYSEHDGYYFHSY